MSIHENLRMLRLAANMTQEEAAEKVGLTRQGLSSYETGRTQPDVDMLKRLAEVYGADLESVLYGGDRAAQACRTIRRSAVILYTALVSMTFVSSALLWTANRCFAVPEGVMTETARAIFAIRSRLTGAWELIDSLLLTGLMLGLLFLLLYCTAKKYRCPLKQRLAWAAVCAASIFLIAFCFGVTDRVYQTVDYMITPCLAAGRLLLFLIVDLLIQKLQTAPRQRKSAAG